MKNIFIAIILLLSTVTIQAQQATNESKAIEKTILNYIENFFENNFEEMNKSLHPRLAKRGLNPDRTLSEDFPPQKLKELMQKKQIFPLKNQSNLVENIAVFGDMAKASLVTGYPNTRWVEYIHLVKLDNEWKIINVFWEFYPKEK